jgi:branched-chain amino acid transport system substrate-binding protein
MGAYENWSFVAVRHRLRSPGIAISFILALFISWPVQAQQPSGQPIRVGGTLAVTGPLAAAANIHKIVAEIYVADLNKRGGLLGRPVEYLMLDDQAKPDLARTLYERLVTSDKVDLLIGGYGTAVNVVAMAVAQRYGKLLISSSMAIPKLSTYDRHFPTQGVPPDPENTFMTLLLDAFAGAGKEIKSVSFVTSKFSAVQFIAEGARAIVGKRGISIPLYVEYEFGTRDFGPIAARVKDADSDLLWMGALGIEGVQLIEALKKIGYTPKAHFYMFPAPGPMAKLPEANNALTVAVFEEHPPFTDQPGMTEFVRSFHDRASKAGLPYLMVDHQAAIEYASWQVLEAGVKGANSLDDKAIADWLRKSQVDTLIGRQRFDGLNNYGPDLHKLSQLQNGQWKVVYPKQWAAPNTSLNLVNR